jgi:cytochrome c peroxidase
MKNVTFGCLTLGAAVGAALGCGSSHTATTESTEQAVSAMSFDCRPDPIKRGEKDFDHAVPSGNGRSCETCHVEEDGFALTPAHVEAAYQAIVKKHPGHPNFKSDPIFQSIDADDFAENFTRLRQGLIRVTLPVPANVTIDELPGATQISFWRAVPTILNVAFTGPYQFDQRAANLQVQANGALLGHIQPKHMPGQDFLDDVAAYELDQFSSPAVRTLFEQLSAGQNPPRAEPPDLTAEEQQGRDAFNFRCGFCHNGNQLRSGPISDALGRAAALTITRLNAPNLPVYTFRVTQPDGTVGVIKTPDPGRGLISGVFADFSRFKIPTLYGISKTAPYFHDNSHSTLEDVMDFYQTDFEINRNEGQTAPFLATPMSPDELRLIPMYLRRL